MGRNFRPVKVVWGTEHYQGVYGSLDGFFNVARDAGFELRERPDTDVTELVAAKDDLAEVRERLVEIVAENSDAEVDGYGVSERDVERSDDGDRKFSGDRRENAVKNARGLISVIDSGFLDDEYLVIYVDDA